MFLKLNILLMASLLDQETKDNPITLQIPAHAILIMWKNSFPVYPGNDKLLTLPNNGNVTFKYHTELLASIFKEELRLEHVQIRQLYIFLYDTSNNGLFSIRRKMIAFNISFLHHCNRLFLVHKYVKKYKTSWWFKIVLVCKYLKKNIIY